MIRPEIVVSVWLPWRTATWPQNISIEDQVRFAITLQADAITVKGTNGVHVYGKREALIFPFNKSSNDDMELEAKRQGLGVDLWCWADCKDPIRQARAIRDAVARWNPRNVKLDIEGPVAKKYAHNTGAFLRALRRLKRHDGTDVKVWLQSYRRPYKHLEIEWIKWLTYTDQAGHLLVDGVAPQAYYIGTQDSVSDFERMLKDYDKLELEIGGTLDWHVTLPTFKEHGWIPMPESLEAGINFLRRELGDRLKGVDYWRLGWLLTDQGSDMAAMLIAYDWGEEDEEVEPEPEPEILFEQRPENERWQIIGGDLRRRGVVNGA